MPKNLQKSNGGGSRSSCDRRELYSQKSNFQKSIFQQLCSQIKLLPNSYCYTFTLSPASNVKRHCYQKSTTYLQKDIGNFLNTESIKKCFYTIEQSKHGKYHAHGIILTKPTFKYAELNTRHPGMQIYVTKYYPDNGPRNVQRTSTKPDRTGDTYKPEYWAKYIVKDPLRYIEYTSGKNFIKYEVYVGRGAEGGEGTVPSINSPV